MQCHAMPRYYHLTYTSPHLALPPLYIVHPCNPYKISNKKHTINIEGPVLIPYTVLLIGYHRRNMKISQSLSQSLMRRKEISTPRQVKMYVQITQSYPDSPATHTPTSLSRNTRPESNSLGFSMILCTSGSGLTCSLDVCHDLYRLLSVAGRVPLVD